jgi:hypothetical protein
MAGGIDWFRWHHGSVTDPKFLLVSRKAGASLPDVVAVWAYLLEKASAATERGTFGEIDAEALDCLFNFPSTETRTADILEAMTSRDLIGNGRITAWEARQPKRERDPAPLPSDAPAPMTSTERSRLHRAKQSQGEPAEAMQRRATPCNATGDQATPRGEERREEKETPPTPDGVVPPTASPRATRKCPTSFVVTPELLAWAASEAPGVPLETETAKLRDHTFKTAISDWQGAWRNWMRKAQGYLNDRTGRGNGGPVTFADKAKQRMDALTGRTAPAPAPTTKHMGEIFDAAD